MPTTNFIQQALKEFDKEFILRDKISTRKFLENKLKQAAKHYRKQGYQRAMKGKRCK